MRSLRSVLSVVTIGLAVALAGCGSSGSSTTTTAAGTSTSATTAPSAAQSKTQITSAYMTLFDLSNPAVAPKVAVVQGGTGLTATFAKELKTPLAKRAGGAKVVSVKVEHGSSCQTEALGSPCAAVTYDILTPAKKTLLANSKGFAVYIGGKWLVAKSTICTLLSLANNNVNPKGC